MRTVSGLSRREFLRVVPAAGAGLVLAVCFEGPGSADAAAPDAEGLPFAPNAFVQVDAAGVVTIWATSTELGQGARTALPMILADEMEADWSRVRVEQAFTHPKFGDLGTGGSTSVRTRFLPMRQAGAAARVMLIGAAAKRWDVEPSSCRADKGAVVHSPTGRRLDYGALAAVAATMSIPKDPPLKDPKDFRLIGTSVPRTDTPMKVDGSAIYGIDFKLPGMLYACVARCPVFSGKAVSFKAARAKAVAGVRDVVAITTGVAVLADSSWAAIKGRDALEVSWDEGAGAGENDADLRRQMDDLSKTPGKEIRNDGDVAAAVAAAARKIESVYELPYLAHATLEPQNATARVTKDRCEIWAPTQFPGWVFEEARGLTGLPPESVIVHVTLVGGGFGRRINPDYALEAVEISRKAGVPVKTVWTREDDLQHDVYRPASHHRLVGGLDASGKPVAWYHRIVSPSIEAWSTPDTKEPEQSEIGGARDLPYGIPNLRVEYAPAKSSVPRGYWRSVGNSFNGFVVECFLDEMAAAAGKDPYQFRLDLLGPGRKITDPASGQVVMDTGRLKAALQLAAGKAGWGAPLPKGHARGIAAHFSFRTYCAQVAEVSVESGALKIHRVVCAVDCGRVVNPNIVAQQMEGAVVFGLTAALKPGITIEKGRVLQSNYNDYPVLRINEAPPVEVHFLAGGEPPTGVGEPGVPVIAPAVFNALFAATGLRVRRLPLQETDLRGA